MALFCHSERFAPAAADIGPAFNGPRTLSVIDPVDLATNRPDSAAGLLLRRSLAENPAWKVLSGDSTHRQLRDLGIFPELPCAEFQCAFNAGNALQSEFVLFGTATDLPEVNAYTLGVVHVPTSQMVWSRVGHAPKRSSGEGKRRGNILEGPLRFAVADLGPATLDLRKRPSLGLLGVLDGGQSTPHSRVAMHRALAHAYASRAYDMLGPAELDALLSALDLDPATGHARGIRIADAGEGTGVGAVSNPGVGGSAKVEGDSPGAGGNSQPNAEGYSPGVGGDFHPGAGDDMLALGSAMGLRYLLRSQVRTEGREYEMSLALYDVAGRKPLRQWPSKGTDDYASLLGLEDRFMTALGDQGPIPQSAPARRPWRALGKGAAIGLATLGGAALGYLAWQNKVEADHEYARFKAARTADEANDARARVMSRDTEARKFGILGGLSLAVGAAVWSF